MKMVSRLLSPKFYVEYLFFETNLFGSISYLLNMLNFSHRILTTFTNYLPTKLKLTDY